MQRQIELSEDRALLVLQRMPLGVLLGLLEERFHQPLGVPAAPRPPSPAADNDRATEERVTVRTSSSRSSSNTSGRTMLTMTRPTGSFAARNSAIPSAVSWTGISSSSVTRCTAVSGDFSTLMTACAWLCIGPILASPATSSLTFRKRVIRPVGGASITT